MSVAVDVEQARRVDSSPASIVSGVPKQTSPGARVPSPQTEGGAGASGGASGLYASGTGVTASMIGGASG